jgi:hypothetical protein
MYKKLFFIKYSLVILVFIFLLSALSIQSFANTQENLLFEKSLFLSEDSVL